MVKRIIAGANFFLDSNRQILNSATPINKLYHDSGESNQLNCELIDNFFLLNSRNLIGYGRLYPHLNRIDAEDELPAENFGHARATGAF
jgi:hypothetical protein